MLQSSQTKMGGMNLHPDVVNMYAPANKMGAANPTNRSLASRVKALNGESGEAAICRVMQELGFSEGVAVSAARDVQAGKFNHITATYKLIRSTYIMAASSEGSLACSLD